MSWAGHSLKSAVVADICQHVGVFCSALPGGVCCSAVEQRGRCLGRGVRNRCPSAGGTKSSWAWGRRLVLE
ncbi:hypothetical protein EV126DRAFT_459795 [Verticillium dahliae]|nr:hypothetical protein EV126DRAFT_459795 [Verticillium dahliae]